jgi:uncharacterized protein (DUF1684 family)
MLAPMADPAAALLELAHWRGAVSRLYAEVREASEKSPAGAWEAFRSGRDSLFASHPQSPLDKAQKKRFTRLDYYPYNPRLRFRVPVTPLPGGVKRNKVAVDLDEGSLRYRPFAIAAFDRGQLTLFWMEGYGGGLFLPFRDQTNKRETYGGGRYLYDTIKGADLGAGGGEIVLDFNFAYNPSCAYSPRWVCPLSPAENTLTFRVEAGERLFAES